jgi:hypothetical protein
MNERTFIKGEFGRMLAEKGVKSRQIRHFGGLCEYEKGFISSGLSKSLKQKTPD